jgi:Na+-driven multidrug efflux pump
MHDLTQGPVRRHLIAMAVGRRDAADAATTGAGLGCLYWFLPAMALAFAVTPVAGQNFGAQLHGRVRETFR